MEITNDIKETIIQSYNDGKSINYLSKTHKIPKKEISSLLKLNGIIIQKYRHTKYPDTMLSEIIPLYEKRDYQSIFELYPELSKKNLYYIMSKNKIHTDKEWTSEEINILKKNHKLPYKELSVLLPQHSSSAIQLQANRLGYSHRSF